jgi:AcrR family transcriptional regulator
MEDRTVLYGDMSKRAGKTLLTRQDWTNAALDALAEHGVAGVAVDRLARELGVTRGSFYWHFSDRRELIDAALEQWEREYTTDLLPEVEAVEDPVDRLRFVFREVYERPVDRIEMALAVAADDPLVAPVVARVTRTRRKLLRRIFTGLGLSEEEAFDRAWLAYAFYTGHHQLGRNDEIRVERPNHLDRIVDLLVSPPAAPNQTTGSPIGARSGRNPRRN